MTRHGEAPIGAREAEPGGLCPPQRFLLDDLFQADAAKQRKQSEREERRRLRLILAARDTLGTENGKRLLYWLINQTGVFAPCFTGNSTTFFLEGKRSIGLEVYRLLMEADPEALQRLIDFQRREEALSARETPGAP